jgi:N-hydroxyarylamine O-acetyltransferase
MDWLALLDRLGVAGREPTLATLCDVQRQALLHLPFENLDIHLGRSIELHREALYRKIVAGDRGGFCYELNECLYQCLVAMGYDVERWQGRVELGGSGAAFDHQVVCARVDGTRWVADIGFGDSAMAPLDLDRRDEQSDGRTRFRVDASAAGFQLHQLWQGGDWRHVLTLVPEPQPWAAFGDRCRWQQTSSDSAFVRKRLCTQATPKGRVSLSGNTLKETVDGTVRETCVAESDYTSVLAQRFGIHLGAPRWCRPVT